MKKDGGFSPVHHLFVTVVEIPASQLMLIVTPRQTSNYTTFE